MQAVMDRPEMTMARVGATAPLSSSAHTSGVSPRIATFFSFSPDRMYDENASGGRTDMDQVIQRLEASNAQHVAKFGEVRGDLREIAGRIDASERVATTRFDAIERRFTAMDSTLSRIDGRLDKMDTIAVDVSALKSGPGWIGMIGMVTLAVTIIGIFVALK